MTLVERCTEAGLLWPHYGANSLCSLLPTVASALGVEVNAPSNVIADAGWSLPTANGVIVMLVDGLGAENLRARSQAAPFLNRHLNSYLYTGFPATTAASLASFGTGATPGTTGMVGYTARNPRTKELATLVSWRNGGDPAWWQREPQLLAQLAQHVAVARVTAPAFANSGLTNAVLQGGRFVGAASLSDRVDQAAYEVSAGGLVYLYWEQVDAIGHVQGWTSRAWSEAVTHVDREFSRLLSLVPKGTVVLMVADHGMVDVATNVDMSTSGLLAGVDLVGGEPRALHLYCQDGEAVAQRWRSLTDAVVALRSQAIAAGLFGPVAPHVTQMIGDVVVLATGNTIYTNSQTMSRQALQLKGHHGSLTSAEVTVPLIVCVA